MYKPLLCILLTILPYNLAAQQNLVPNPSFEEVVICPEHREEYGNLVAWYSPTLGSPDVHHSCINATGSEEVPQNGFGWQFARTGESYMGFIIVVAEGPNEYREYIQCKLNEPLTYGESYVLEFFVSRSDSSTKACDNIGAFVSKTPVTVSDNFNLPYVPQVVSPPNEPITDAVNWVQVSGTFEATGDEQYLTIGVFSNNANTNWVAVDGGWEDEAHYYIDDVSVRQLEEIMIPNAFSPNGDGVNDKLEITLLLAESGELTIYDRWGIQVYSTSGSILEWDGQRADGKRANESIYYVVVKTTRNDNGKNFKKGFVHLLR